MSHRLISCLIWSGALALTACAPTSGATDQTTPGTRAEHQCFDVSQVRNFRQGRSGTLYLRVRNDEVYQADQSGGCLNLNFAFQLAVLPDLPNATGGRVCIGDSARVVTPGPSPHAGTCRVRVSKRLTAEEVDALPAAQRP